MIVKTAFFDVSPFYYDSEQKCNLVRHELGLDDLFLTALDDVDEHPNRATCQHCGTPVGWRGSAWRPLGLVQTNQNSAPWVLCPSCFANGKQDQR